MRWLALSALFAALAACSTAGGNPAGGGSVAGEGVQATQDASGPPASGPADSQTATDAVRQGRPDLAGGLPVPVQRSDDQLYILELRLKNWVLSEGLFGYAEEGGLLLPLGETARALEFPISVDPLTGRANGWFLSENRLFSLDIARREVVVEGRPGTVDPRFVELHADDIYVDTRILSRWFPVNIDFDLSNSLVMIRSREPLEVERRLEREQIRGTLSRRRDLGQPAFEEQDVPYQFVSSPFVDTSTETGYRRDVNGDDHFVARYSSLITADLLYTSASMFLSGNQDDPLTEARLTLGRKDPDGELLGPIGATEYAAGDITSPETTLISDPHFGRGAQISSFPLGQEGEFDRTTLIGDLPLGWSVELYRNEVLLDFRTARPDGRYEFVDVPLLFGVNLLRLRFFGPQGQRREETRRILVGEDQISKGEFKFALSANQHETDLLPVEDDQAGVPDPATQGEGRFFARAEYGVTKKMSLTGGVSSIPLISGRRTYGSVGARLGLANTFTELDLVADDQGGLAGQIALQASLPGDLGLFIEHGQFSDFVSEDVEDEFGLLQYRSKIRLDGVVGAGSLFRVPFTLSAQQERYESGREETEIANLLSAAISRVAVSNNFAWRRIHETTGDTITADGTFLASGRIARASLRGEATYDIQPTAQITSAGITGEWFFDTDLSARLRVRGEFGASSRTVYGAGISKTFRLASVGVETEYGTDGSALALLTVSFGLGREPRSGSWHGSSDPMAAKGTVSARAFVDNDLDGVYSDGDTPLEGVRFDTSRGLPRATTDSEGVVLLSGLPPYEPMDIYLPARSLEDPYWVARPEGRSFTLRPGATAVADFPVVTTGEIDGTVYLERNGVRRDVARVKVQLVDESGQVVKSVETAYDGFYLFDSVLPGRYRVRIDSAQLARLNLTASPARDAVIGADGTVISGMAFTLRSSLGQ